MNAPKVDWETELAGLLEWVKGAAEAGEGFVLEQAPQVAQEIVAWTLWSGVATLAVGIVLIMVAVVGSWKFVRWLMDTDCEEAIPAVMVALFPLVFGCVLVGPGGAKAMKAAFAPRLVVIDYIAERIP